jgi:hypothetical protein
MTRPVRIFVSHSHNDDAFTNRLVSDLIAAGADVWVDSKQITNDDFMKRINEGLKGRHWLVLVMSPHSLHSPYVAMEVNAALHLTQRRLMRGVIPNCRQSVQDRRYSIPLVHTASVRRHPGLSSGPVGAT